MTFDRERPFNGLPKVPPATELESRAVLKKAIGARAALEALRGAGTRLPNQAVLLQAIGLQEARLSSEIENVVTTNDALYRAFADEGQRADPQTKEVLRYQQALWRGFQAVKQENRALSTRVFEEIVSTIRMVDLRVRRVPGTRLVDSSGAVVYTPPDGEDLLRDLLANLERFLYAEDDLEPLVRMAVAHYQFEAIHPFSDGNGRTGRILNILFLVERGLLDLPVLYLSSYILREKASYYALLRGVTEEQAWEPWVLFVLEAVERTSLETRTRIESLLALIEKWRAEIQARAPKVYSKDLVEIVFRHPYTKIAFLQAAGLGTRQTASKYLQELSRLGLLRPIRIGREVYFLNEPFLAALIQ